MKVKIWEYFDVEHIAFFPVFTDIAARAKLILWTSLKKIGHSMEHAVQFELNYGSINQALNAGGGCWTFQMLWWSQRKKKESRTSFLTLKAHVGINCWRKEIYKINNEAKRL